MNLDSPANDFQVFDRLPFGCLLVSERPHR